VNVFYVSSTFARSISLSNVNEILQNFNAINMNIWLSIRVPPLMTLVNSENPNLLGGLQDLRIVGFFHLANIITGPMLVLCNFYLQPLEKKFCKILIISHEFALPKDVENNSKLNHLPFIFFALM